MKPNVGVIFSGARTTSESKDLGLFLGALLYLGKYSCVKFVELDSDEKSKSQEETETVKVFSGGAVHTLCSSTDFQLNSKTEALETCHLIVVTVFSDDTPRCAELISKLPPMKDKMRCIVSLQHGCKNFEKLSSILTEKQCILMDGVCALHVSRSAVDGLLLPLVHGGSLVLERLSKEKAEEGEKFLNLLSTMNLPILFRKLLTRNERPELFSFDKFQLA